MSKLSAGLVFSQCELYASLYVAYAKYFTSGSGCVVDGVDSGCVASGVVGGDSGGSGLGLVGEELSFSEVHDRASACASDGTDLAGQVGLGSRGGALGAPSGARGSRGGACSDGLGFVSGAKGAAVEGPRGTVDSRDDSLGVVRGYPRGVNYARNKANRMRQKVRKQVEAEQARGGYYAGCSAEVQRDLREGRAKLVLLENERKAIEEQRKIRRLNTSIGVAEEVVSALKLSKTCESLAKDKSVAGWAATISDSYANSLASSVESGASVKGKAESRKKRMRQDALLPSVVKLNYLEEAIVKWKKVTVDQVHEIRVALDRPMVLDDLDIELPVKFMLSHPQYDWLAARDYVIRHS